jgi:glutamine---fructose-6-phosphate transaminase (isomerizing)
MSGQSSLFAQEIEEVETVLLRQKQIEWPKIRQIAKKLRAQNPTHAITIARGSSDHAALFIGLLISRLGGLAVASLTPSFASLYHGSLKPNNSVAIAVSQSGQSPDLLTLLAMVKKSGASSLAILNEINTPLASIADDVIGLHAAPERAVAATKSVMASLSAGLTLTAEWFQDRALADALDDVHQMVSTALVSQKKCEAIANINQCYVIGRGMTLPIAMEAALKLKETCIIHAEAFSSAEILHGPAALIKEGFPILAFVPDDEARESLLATIKQLETLGARIISFDAADENETSHPFLAPVKLLHNFYRHVEAIARLKGLNPDQPPHLKKVTLTV